MKTLEKFLIARQIKHITDMFKILCDPTRVRILDLFFSSHRPLCVTEIASLVQISQSNASHQLSKLEMRGIVTSFRDGQTVCYELTDTEITRHIKKALYLFKEY
jgi:DNA-binding transcriptional ArsR family regulator